MNDKNIHINQKLDSNYPEPDVPVDDAWAEMNAMLNDPPMPPGKGGGGGIRGRFWKLFLFVIGIGLIILTINQLYKKADTLTTNSEPDTITKVVPESLNQTIINKNNTKQSGNIPPDSFSIKSAIALIKNDENSTKTAQDTLSKYYSGPVTPKQRTNNGKAGLDNPLINSSANKPGNRNNIDNSNAKLANARIKNNTFHQPVNNNSTSTGISNTNKGLNNSDDNSTANDSLPLTDADTQKNNNSLPIISAAKLLKSSTAPRLIEKIKNPLVKKPLGAIDVSNSNATIKALLAEQNKLKNKSKKPASNFTYGIQLNAGIPLQQECFCNFTVGVNGKKQPWKLLIPGIWAGKIFAQKHEVSLQFTPYQQYFIADKVISSSTIYLPPGLPEDTLLATKTTRIIKAFGLNAGIHYNYRFNNKWTVGLGVDYNAVSGILMSEEVKRVYDGKVFQYNLSGIKSKDYEQLECEV